MSFWSKLGLADAASVAAMKDEILALRKENSELHEAQARQTQQLYNDCVDGMRKTAVSIEGKVSMIGEQMEALQPELVSCLHDSKQEILSAGSSHQDHVMRLLTVMLDNQESFKENVSSMAASREQALSQIVELINEMRAVQERTLSQIAELTNRMESVHEQTLPQIAELTSGMSTVQEQALPQIVDLINGMRADQEQAVKHLEEQYSDLDTACQTISDRLVSLKENEDRQRDISQKMVDKLGAGHIELQNILNTTQDIAENISFLHKYTESLWEAMKLVWINELVDQAAGDSSHN